MSDRLLDLPTLSPSALGSYEICGRRGQFYHDRSIPRTTNATLTLGSSYHTALENLYRGETWGEASYRAFEYMVAAWQGDDFIVNDGDMSLAEAHTALSVMLQAYVDEQAQWKNVQSVEHEVRADFGAASHVLLGFIDLTVKGDTDDHILVDHKTAGRAWGGAKKAGDPRKLLQAPLYAEAYEMQNPGIHVNWFAYDVMTYKGKFHRTWVNVSPDARRPFIKRWVDMAQQIEMYNDAGMEMPCNPSGFLCSSKWCSYWDMCEMGSPLEQTLEVIGT